jgi:uncharacterized protein YbaP (TraB family)
MTFVRLSLIITALLLSCFSSAQTSIWQVSNGKNTVYLGGTFHMLKPSDYPLPLEFEEVYKKVNWLVFETDISQLNSTEFEKKFINTMSLPSGQILADRLSPQAYSGLIHYAAKNNIDTGRLQRFKPQMVCLMISLQELNKLGLTAQGVEQYLGDKAIIDGKKMTELETIDEQIHYVATMGQGNETALILQTLEDLKTLPDDLNIMSTAWRSGDVESLFNTGIKPMMENYPEVYRSLLVERNNNWLPKIEQLIQQPDEKFILVGALHLIGEDGLLQQLRNRGYTVQQY